MLMWWQVYYRIEMTIYCLYKLQKKKKKSSYNVINIHFEKSSLFSILDKCIKSKKRRHFVLETQSKS